jgi:hypothetical protein
MRFVIVQRAFKRENPGCLRATRVAVSAIGLGCLTMLGGCQADSQRSVCADIERDISKLESKKDRTVGDDYVLAALIRERSERDCP